MEAKKIAKYILFKAKEDDDLISNMKLQKLLYYAQGFHLAVFDEPLFDDEIEHWMHGPAVRTVYEEYKEFKNNAIEYPENYDLELNDENLNLLNEVLDVYGQFTASALRNMSHSETPWKSTKDFDVISHDLLKDFFKTRIN